MTLQPSETAGVRKRSTFSSPDFRRYCVGIISALFFSVGLSHISHAQDFDPTPVFRPYHINIEYAQGLIQEVHFDQFSLNLAYRAHRNIGINWNLDWIERSDGQRQIHFPAGPVFGVGLTGTALFAGGSFAGGQDLLFFLLLSAVPDGISGHFYLNEYWEISPYMNALGFDVITEPEWGDPKMEFNFSFGTKLTHINPNHFTTSIFLETRKTKRVDWGYSAGVGVGYLFGNH